MIAMLSLENVLAWAAQVSVLIGMGAILPAVFRIRHPRWANARTTWRPTKPEPP